VIVPLYVVSKKLFEGQSDPDHPINESFPLPPGDPEN
jgi:hypothetical protein